jgi:hypothetical protein
MTAKQLPRLIATSVVRGSEKAKAMVVSTPLISPARKYNIISTGIPVILTLAGVAGIAACGASNLQILKSCLLPVMNYFSSVRSLSNRHLIATVI